MIPTGGQAPDFKLPGFAIAEELKRGSLLLVIFKVSCPTCQFTLPFLDRLHQQGVRVFGISEDDAEGTREFTDYFAITFPIHLEGPAYPVSDAFQIANVPAMFYIEPSGRVAWSLNGFHKVELERLGHLTGAAPFREAERVPAMRPG